MPGGEMHARALGASAPGKLMLAGEYAVLEGAPALVAAVSARVEARLAGSSRAQLPPEVERALELAEKRLGPVPHGLVLETSALVRDDRKLGLGSSSAGAAAAVAAVHAWHGREVQGLAVRMEILDDAMRGHRAVAPEGSGADVAAAVLGGFVRFRRDGERFEVMPLPWPAFMRLSVVWTGVPARTSDLVRRVKELAARAPDRYHASIDAVAEASRAMIVAVERRDATALVDAAAIHAHALAALGEAAGAPIVEERLGRIIELARIHGGAAKPSGAGGGDVAIAFFAEPAAVAEFEQACSREGMAPLDLTLGAPGVLPLGG